MKNKKMILTLATIFALVVASGSSSSGSGCSNDLGDQTQTSVDSRIAVMDRAVKLYPSPDIKMLNFPQRQLLIEYTLHQDMINQPWYTYIMSDTGAITHYFVSTTIPVSTNAFLGNTDTIAYDKHGNVYQTSAPSLDGLYYGGAGSTSNANGWIFKDANNGGLGIAFGHKILVYEYPLILQTEPILIQGAPPPTEKKKK